MTNLRSPITWYGGKSLLQRRIVPLLPPHHTYVEVFGGGANVLLNKEPAPVEVYNDLDAGLANFFEVLSDPELFEQFYRRVSVLPVSRGLYYKYRDSWEAESDPVVRAAQWFLVARQSFSGHFGVGGWSYNVTKSRRGMSQACSKWLSAIDLLPDVHARLQRVQIESRDFRDLLKYYDTPETLFYLDPPYTHTERASTAGYAHEMSDADHADLVALLLELDGYAVLSGYTNPIYVALEAAGWARHDFDVPCRATGRTRATGVQGAGAASGAEHRRVDSLWVKPWAVDALPLFAL